MKLSSSNMQAMPGFVGMTDSGRRVFGAFGLVLDRMREKLWFAAKNRLSESRSAALIYEFGLPNHPALLRNKWQHSIDRGTKLGLKNMMEAIGLPNFTVYTRNGITFNNGTTMPSPPSNLNAKYSAVCPESYNSAWWTLVVWDVPKPYPDPLGVGAGGVIKVGSMVVGKNIGFENIDTATYDPYPTPDHDVVRQICEYQSPVGEPCLDVVFCYNSESRLGTSRITGACFPVDTLKDTISSRYVNRPATLQS